MLRSFGTVFVTSHEVLDPGARFPAQLAAFAQFGHQGGIVHGLDTEAGWRHRRMAREKFFNLGKDRVDVHDQHNA